MISWLRRWSRRLLLVTGTAMLVMAVPARAEFLPPFQDLGGPEDQAIVADLAEIMSGLSQPSDTRLEALDEILNRLTRPNRLRGLAQFLRGLALLGEERALPAREALEESIRLLPGYSGPLIVASSAEIYSDRPDRAVDYLLRASRIDPEIVRQIPDYELWNILERLETGPHRRQLASRLFEIGWLGESLSRRSSLARTVIEARVEDGDLNGARNMIPHLASPMQVRSLLMQNAYRELWPDLEEWAGPRQARLWPLYLTELRERWQASNDLEMARPYLLALAAANRHHTIVDEFLPLFSSPDPQQDYQLIWVAAPLAQSLAQLGRWDEIEALFASALERWPTGADANALNLLANRGSMRYSRGDFEGAVADFRLALADPAAATGEVSATALNSIHHYLACSLHELGRDVEGVASVARILALGSAVSTASLHLCHGRYEAARTALLAGLTDEAERAGVIQFVQLANGPPLPSRHERLMRERIDALRVDPGLLAEVEKYGRVLPYPAGAGAAGATEAEQPSPI